MKQEHTKELIWDALKAYIDYVGKIEGVSFLSPRNQESFTKEQWEVLTLADEENDQG
jgi:hypothetical protein